MKTMAAKTPQTTVKDYLQNVNTENEAHRVLRRRSVVGDGAGGDSIGPTGSASKQQGRRPQVRSPRLTKNSLRAQGRNEEEEVTPRHIIQNMLTVQGTAQPVTRKRKRMSDVPMGPPSSTRGRKSARRRSSLSAIDLDDVTRRHTPRTNIVGFLEQAEEETPAARKDNCAGDSRSTTHNISTLMVNEVGVSLLENKSGSGAVDNVSASGGRFRGKKRNLNIPLPQVSPASSSQTQQTHNSARSSRTSTPAKDVRADADGNVEDPPPVSPVPEGQGTDSAGTDAPRDTPASDRSGRSEGNRSKSSERNLFRDILADRKDDASVGDADAETEANQEATASQSSQLETQKIQGGYKANTPSVMLSLSRTEEDGTDTPSEKPHPGSARKGSRRTPDQRRQSPRTASLATKDQSESPRPQSGRKTTLGASQLSGNTPGLSGVEGRLAASSSSDGKDGGFVNADHPEESISYREGESTSMQMLSLASAVSRLSSRHTGRESTLSALRTDAEEDCGDGASAQTAAVTSASSKDRRSKDIEGHLMEISQTGEQLLRDRGDSAATQMPSQSSTVSRLSSRFENQDSTASVLGTQSKAVDNISLEQEDEMYEAGAVVHTASVHESAHRLSEDEESSEGEGYSPLKTPRLPEKQRTPNTALSKLAARTSDIDERTAAANPRRTNKTSRPRKKSAKGLPTSVVKATFMHFCQLRVSREAIEEVERMSEQYWRNMAEDLEAYALHANRRTINESDVELLMKRQGFITDKCSLNTLIAKYLPLELRQELIPIARSGNKLEPGS